MFKDKDVKAMRRVSVDEEAREIVKKSIVRGRSMLSAVVKSWRADLPPHEKEFAIGNRVCELLHLATAEGLDPWSLLEDAADRFFREERDAGTARHDSPFRRAVAGSGGDA